MSPERINVCRMCVSQKYYNWKQSLNISTLHTSYITVVHRKYGNIVFFFFTFYDKFYRVRSFIHRFNKKHAFKLSFICYCCCWMNCGAYICVYVCRIAGTICKWANKVKFHTSQWNAKMPFQMTNKQWVVHTLNARARFSLSLSVFWFQCSLTLRAASHCCCFAFKTCIDEKRNCLFKPVCILSMQRKTVETEKEALHKENISFFFFS